MSRIQLFKLLPLPEDDLQQVLDYAASLSKQEAAEHFNNLLGESPQSIEFISTFNSRRKEPAAPPQPSQSTAEANNSGVPKPIRKGPKKKSALHTPAARQIQDTYASQGTAYVKANEDDYISKRAGSSTNNVQSQPSRSKPPPSASGTLISELKPPKPKAKPSSTPSTRTTSPAPSKPTTKTKIAFPGGSSMHGASSDLSIIDSALRTLELSTNPTTLLPASQRHCPCNATRHPLLAAAPNCLSCGKIICVKEGLGPCTSCHTPLLRADEVQGMIRELRSQRGEEKMAQDRAAHRRADVARQPVPFSAPSAMGGRSPAEQAAKEHRDRLLGFQAENAKRTTVRDEAADFEIPVIGGGNLDQWASPADRARELKRQQKVLAEMEWSARPEWERKREVVSLELVGGKLVKRMGRVEREMPKGNEEEEEEEEEEGEDDDVHYGEGERGWLKDRDGNRVTVGSGSFSRNPLLGALLKPVYPKGETEVGGEATEQKRTMWMRVQDDMDDNEDVILDGGVYGGEGNGDEPACG